MSGSLSAPQKSSPVSKALTGFCLFKHFRQVAKMVAKMSATSVF